MRRLLVAVVALSHLLFAHSFRTVTPSSISSASSLIQQLPNTLNKAALSHPCRIFPTRAMHQEGKHATQLSAVREIPISEPSTGLWARVKSGYRSWNSFYKEYKTFAHGRTEVTTAANTTVATSANSTVAARIRDFFSEPAFRAGLAAASAAWMWHQVIGVFAWGKFAPWEATRPLQLLDVLIETSVSYRSSQWLDAKLPEASVKNIVIKTLLTTLLLGARDSTAIRKFPVTPGGKDVPLPGMEQLAVPLTASLRFLSFKLPLEHRTKFTTAVWGALGAAWVHALARTGSRDLKGNRAWQPPIAEAF